MAVKSNLVSASAMAKHLFVTRQYVSRLADNAVLARTLDGRFDLDRNRELFLSHLRTKKDAKVDSESQYRKLKVQEMAHKLKRLRNESLDAEFALEVIDGLISSFKNTLLSMGRKLSRDPAEQLRIDDVCRSELERLADAYEKGSAAIRAGQPPFGDDEEAGIGDAAEFADDERINDEEGV